MIKSTKDGKFWKKQVDLALQARQKYEPWWEANLTAYAPSVRSSTPDAFGAEIHTNRTFTLVERKKADLFYQRPDVSLQPTPAGEEPLQGVMGPPDPQTGQPSAVPSSLALAAHQQIVNELLGEDGVDATELMDAVLFDIIATQGVGFTKMGYEAVMVEVEQPDPMWQPDPLVPPEMQQPPMVKVPAPIHQHCFWEHFSGKQAVIPHNFRSTNWDKAPFLGMQFELPLTASTRQQYQLPDDFDGTKAGGGRSQHYDHGTDQAPSENVFTGVEIWYRSSLFREDVLHPEHLTQLVLVDGLEANDGIAFERDSPYQDLTPEGQLSPTSLLGFPIHPFSVRKLTDSAYVPSDGTMIRPLENELDISRTQNIQHRDAMGLRYIANGDVLPKESLDKIVRSPIGGIVSVPSEAFHGEGAFKPLDGGTMPRESLVIADYIDADLARTTGVDASGSGVQGTTSQTATAEQIQAANANARMDKERGIVLKRYIKGVTKFSTLVQRYFPVEEAALVVGQGPAQLWEAWRKTAKSSVAFTALPDSALRVDQAVDRKSSVDLYSFLANDPYIQKGRAKLLEKLLRKHHVDPTGIVQPPDPPKPEPPKLSLSVKGEDFVGPQAPVIFEIMQQLGITISDDAKAQTKALGALLAAMNAMQATAEAQAGPEGQTKHGGKMAQQESLSKHASDQTGGMQGSGGPAALGAGGGMLQ